MPTVHPVQSPARPAGLITTTLTAAQRTALEELRRAFARPSSVSALTGESGMGKTVVLQRATAGHKSGVLTLSAATPGTDVQIDRLARGLVWTWPHILVVDDAHLLPIRSFDDLAYVAGSGNVAHVVLAGTPELWTCLHRPECFALERRIQDRSVLFPISYPEALRYIDQVFASAGRTTDTVLSKAETHALLLRACGNMRRINTELARLLEPGNTRRPPRWFRQRNARMQVLRRSAALGLAIIALGMAALAVAGLPDEGMPWDVHERGVDRPVTAPALNRSGRSLSLAEHGSETPR